jgi:hypothetical protein
VATTTDGEGQLILPAEVDRGRDIARILDANDYRRPPVDHGVIDSACLVVAVVGGGRGRAADAFAQLGKGGLVHEWDLDVPPAVGNHTTWGAQRRHLGRVAPGQWPHQVSLLPNGKRVWGRPG